MKTLVAEMTDLELEEAIIPNEAKLRLFFPEDWAPPEKLPNVIQIMFHFKLYGLDWRNDAEFIRICVAMEKLKILEANPARTMIRRSPHITNIH